MKSIAGRIMAWVRRVFGPAGAAPPSTSAPEAAVQAPTVPPSSAVPWPVLGTPTGHLTRAAVESYLPADVFRARDYAPDPVAVEAIRERFCDAEVLIFLGTWCPDTRRELPRFWRIADRAGIEESKITLVGVDRSKQDAEGLAGRWRIVRVPTFILLRGGREVGRIEERPTATLERDIADILAR